MASREKADSFPLTPSPSASRERGDFERDRLAGQFPQVRGWKRRDFLVAGGAVGAAFGLAAVAARATPAQEREAVARLTGAAPVRAGRVTLDLPPLVENGNSVPLSIRVESPMTAADHVRAIHVLVEKNPQPYVASFHLGPRAGRAEVSTRIRLADSQTVTAIVEMSDGSFWSGSADSVVTLAACTESS